MDDVVTFRAVSVLTVVDAESELPVKPPPLVTITVALQPLPGKLELASVACAK